MINLYSYIIAIDIYSYINIYIYDHEMMNLYSYIIAIDIYSYMNI